MSSMTSIPASLPKPILEKTMITNTNHHQCQHDRLLHANAIKHIDLSSDDEIEPNVNNKMKTTATKHFVQKNDSVALSPNEKRLLSRMGSSGINK